MLKEVQLQGVGPVPHLRADWTSRLNMITGDNGLGKSFLLDCCWWALTRNWPSYPAHTTQQGAQIQFRVGEHLQTATFERASQTWVTPSPVPTTPGLVLYAQVDGGFSLWDPVRNQSNNGKSRPPAYLFSRDQVWAGLESDGKILCNGLIRDWASWQRENGPAFQLLSSVLRDLSEDPEHPLGTGPLTRISLDDVRDMPTIRASNGDYVPLVHASAGIKRIVCLAYLLVWASIEHRLASDLIGQPPANQVTFLVDEVEAHLHPRWQRTILRSLSIVMTGLSGGNLANVQLLCVTHSPLILASLEPYFDESQDSLWHFNLSNGEASFEQVPWAQQGDVSNWLVSEIFGLRQARSLDAEIAIEAAEAYMRGDSPGQLKTPEDIHKALLKSLPGHDEFWPRWIVHREGH